VLGYANLVWAIDDVVTKTSSLHIGFVHQEGVDLAGFSVGKFNHNINSFYTFGLPSIATLWLGNL